MTGRLCSSCGDFVPEGQSCACRPPALARRRSIYDAPRWRQFTRPVVIARDLVCQDCGDPNANVVDHLLPIDTLLALGEDPFDPRHCQLLCGVCSGVKDGPRATVA